MYYFFFVDLVLTCIFALVMFGSALASVDSLGGPSRVNTMLSTINLKIISNTNLKIMEQPAGEVIEQVTTESARIAASDAF